MLVTPLGSPLAALCALNAVSRSKCLTPLASSLSAGIANDFNGMLVSFSPTRLIWS
jgi:hypothetical protein